MHALLPEFSILMNLALLAGKRGVREGLASEALLDASIKCPVPFRLHWVRGIYEEGVASNKV